MNVDASLARAGRNVDGVIAGGYAEPVRHWGDIVGICAAGSWAVQLLIVRRLRVNGFRYSDVFGPRIYVEYWRKAPSQGWSRVPLFIWPCLLLVAMFAFLVMGVR